MAEVHTLKRSNKAAGTGARKPASLELLSGPEEPQATAEATPEQVAAAAPAGPTGRPARGGTAKERKPKKQKAKKQKSGKQATAKKAEAPKPEPRAKAPEKAAERKEKARLRYKSRVSRDEVARYFEQIVAGLGQGVIRFHAGEEELVVSPANDCKVEVKARRKGKTERVEFEISWRTEERT